MALEYFSAPVYLAISNIYTYSNYNIIFTYVSFKLIGILSYSLVSLLVYDLLSSNSQRNTIFLILLFNPFFFFYNDIQTSDTIFAIFPLVFGFWVLYKNPIQNRIFNLIICVFFILISVFMVYFTILIIPSVILFGKNNRERIYLVILFFIESILLLAPLLLLHLYTSFVSFTTSAGTVPFLYGSIFSIFRIFGPLPLPEYSLLPVSLTLSEIGVAIVIPILMLKLRKTLSISVAIVLILSFVTELSSVTPDLYLYSFTFLVLSLGSLDFLKHKRSIILLLFLSLFPLVIIQEFYWGLDGTTGVFYWLYPLLHYRIALYNIVPDLSTLTNILLLLNFAIYAILIGVFIKLRELKNPVQIENISNYYDTRDIHNRRHLTAIFHFFNQKYLAIAVFILMLIPILLTPIYSGATSTNDSGFPALQFEINQGNYIFPSNDTYSQSNNNKLIFPSSINEIFFYRNTSSQDYYLKFHVTNTYSSPISLGEYPILKTNLYQVGYKYSLGIPANNTYLCPSYISNVMNMSIPENISQYQISGISNISYYLNGNSSIQFHLNPNQFRNNSLIFNEEVTKLARNQTILWQLSYNNVTYQASIIGSLLYESYYSGGLWHVQTENIGNITLQLNAVIVNFHPTNITTSFDGFSFVMPLNETMNESGFLSLGEFSSAPMFRYNYSFQGYISHIYIISNISHQLVKSFYIEINNVLQQTLLPMESVNITTYGNESMTFLSIGSHSWFINNEMVFIIIGKTLPSPISFEIYFDKVKFFTSESTKISLISIIAITIYLPLAILFYILSENYQSRISKNL